MYDLLLLVLYVCVFYCCCCSFWRTIDCILSLFTKFSLVFLKRVIVLFGLLLLRLPLWRPFHSIAFRFQFIDIYAFKGMFTMNICVFSKPFISVWISFRTLLLIIDSFSKSLLTSLDISVVVYFDRILFSIKVKRELQ